MSVMSDISLIPIHNYPHINLKDILTPHEVDNFFAYYNFLFPEDTIQWDMTFEPQTAEDFKITATLSLLGFKENSKVFIDLP